jgi:TRAP-type C4-dicarboxylate transport system permease small subunit
MRALYGRAMELLHRLCMLVAGTCLVVITIVIPWGVFSRYVMSRALSWPEPVAVVLMIWFSFIAAALCYRERLHISVEILPSRLTGRARAAVLLLAELSVAAISLFMLVYGLRLVAATWSQVLAEFPVVAVGVSYLPVPVGGAVLFLFVIERLLSGPVAAAGREPGAVSLE